MEIPVWVFVLLVIATTGFCCMVVSCLTLVCVRCIKDQNEKKKDLNYRRASLAFYGPNQTTYTPLGAVSYTAIQQGNNKLHTTHNMLTYVPSPKMQNIVQHRVPILEKPIVNQPSSKDEINENNLQIMKSKGLSDSSKSLTLYGQSGTPVMIQTQQRTTSACSSENDEAFANTDKITATSARKISPPDSKPPLPPQQTITFASPPSNDDLFISYDAEFAPNNKAPSRGSLNFSLQYSADTMELIVLVKRASELPAKSEDEMSFYVCLCVVPEDFLWQKSAIQNGSCDPIFNEEFHIEDVLHHKLRQYTLCFMVMRVGQSRDRVVGRVLVHLSDLRADMVVDMWRELKAD